jgi:hypothetical protein
MSQHIEQFENYKEDKKNKCCASAKIFETYGVENIKIELVEHLNDVTDKELLERESYYINNFPCVNIRSNKTCKTHRTLPRFSITYNVKTQLGDIFNKEVQNMYSHIFNDKKATKGCINMICYFLKFELLKETISFIDRQEYAKLYLISEPEAELNIKKLFVDKLIIDKPQEISKELITEINRIFRCEMEPKSFNECIDYYVNKLKHLIYFMELKNKQIR